MYRDSGIYKYAGEAGYVVDEYGKVFVNGTPVVHFQEGKGGRLHWFIEYQGKMKAIYIHRLQGFQKYGDRIFRKTVKHQNNKRTDNSYPNIRI